jgi:hypothetical protein
MAFGLTFVARRRSHDKPGCDTLEGGMTTRRLKTYTGQTGYVYQYYFVGKREALPGSSNAPTTGFIFDVSSDRKLTYAVSVLLPRAAVDAWVARHGRSITDAEQYASAKMRLHRGFDEIPDMLAHGRQLLVTPDLFEELLSELGVDQ